MTDENATTAPARAELTLRQKILLAAADLARDGDGGFAVDALARLGPLDESALVLAAWRASPGLFGLPGHEWEYPDAGAVRTRIGGASGCVHRGWVERREDGRYAVTRAGRRGLGEGIERAAEACRGGAIGPARRAVGAAEEGER